MQPTKPTKRILEIARSFGPEYSVRVIDGENVLYRAVNGYEFEVSGLDHNRERIKATVYIWERTISSFIVETIEDFHSLSRLADTLAEKAHEYSTREHTMPDGSRRQG